MSDPAFFVERGRLDFKINDEGDGFDRGDRDRKINSGGNVT